MEGKQFNNATDMVDVNATTSREQAFPITFNNGIEQVISPEAFDMFFQVVFIMNESISAIGVATNIINIIVFVKLGLRESTSISMMCLAVSDLLLTCLAVWSNLLYIPQFRTILQPLRVDEMFILTGGSTRIFVSRTSALITTYIALERCLCVIAPLKVKRLITRRRTSVAMVTLFSITLGPSLFIYNNYHFEWKHFDDVNRTLLGVTFIDTVANNLVDRVIMSLVGTTFLLVAFVTTSLCTVYLVVHLHRSSKWRLGHATSPSSNTNQNTTSLTQSFSVTATDGSRLEKRQTPRTKSAPAGAKGNKEDRVARTVIVLAILFIVCFFPGCVMNLLYVVMPGFTMYGRHGQLFILLSTLGFVIEPINSSFNLFIYYSMGTHFRTALHQMFHLKKT